MSDKAPTLTTNAGIPVVDNQNSAAGQGLRRGLCRDMALRICKRQNDVKGRADAQFSGKVRYVVGCIGVKYVVV